MKKVLFICTGNTCRSPMAQALFNKYAADNGIDASADSAGIAAANGMPASDHAVKVLGEIGIDLSGHSSKQISTALLDSADLIICMNRQHAAMLKDAGIECTVFGGGITDPYGCPIETYRECRDKMIAAMPEIAALLK